MPANRQTLNRDQKASEILDVAEQMFMDGGFDGTTIAALARRAGVAGNTVYWYFPSKDDLLAAILTRRLDRVLAAVPGDVTMSEAATAALAALDEFAPLTAVVHERARRSPAVADAHERFHHQVDHAIRDAFERSGLSRDDARSAARAIVAMVEGIHLHDPLRDPQARNALVRWVLHRLAP